jgi:hypothetical protein
MPSFVVDELRDYLRCGVLARGAVRLLCEHCGRDRLVALSCKGRGFCPRSMGRRMTEMARHWVSAVLPRVRVRPWVLSLPFALRVPLAYHHDLTLAVHGVAARVIEGWYRDKGRELGITDPRTGHITAVQRFGSDLAAASAERLLDARKRIVAPALDRRRQHAETTRELVHGGPARHQLEHRALAVLDAATARTSPTLTARLRALRLVDRSALGTRRGHAGVHVLPSGTTTHDGSLPTRILDHFVRPRLSTKSAGTPYHPMRALLMNASRP